MNVVPTRATYNIARDILAETPKHGADATLRHLPRVQAGQVAALLALIAKAAVTGDIPTPEGEEGRGRPKKPTVFTPDERRRAHMRYRAGGRDFLTVNGEREYQRVVRRRERAAKIRAGKV